ncbi:hypothetical protein GCM10027259_30440 [Micromonospora palomenae]
MGEQDGADWRERQRRAAAAHAAADERRQATEHAAAAELVAWFAAEATRRGLRPDRITATAYDGRSRYRTRLSGWYVNRARTEAVDARGQRRSG